MGPQPLPEEEILKSSNAAAAHKSHKAFLLQSIDVKIHCLTILRCLDIIPLQTMIDMIHDAVATNSVTSHYPSVIIMTNRFLFFLPVELINRFYLTHLIRCHHLHSTRGCGKAKGKAVKCNIQPSWGNVTGCNTSCPINQTSPGMCQVSCDYRLQITVSAWQQQTK